MGVVEVVENVQKGRTAFMESVKGRAFQTVQTNSAVQMVVVVRVATAQ
jgi:hypothetical protein